MFCSDDNLHLESCFCPHGNICQSFLLLLIWSSQLMQEMHGQSVQQPNQLFGWPDLLVGQYFRPIFPSLSVSAFITISKWKFKKSEKHPSTKFFVTYSIRGYSAASLFVTANKQVKGAKTLLSVLATIMFNDFSRYFHRNGRRTGSSSTLPAKMASPASSSSTLLVVEVEVAEAP